MNKIIHLLSVPWTGLGLYNGFRGNRWLKNRITIFKKFVIPSLQNQTSKNFILHCCWRQEERTNPHVQALIEYLDTIKDFKTVHTFYGILFFDDKYPDEIARDRLLMSLHNSMGELVNVIGECDFVFMTIQPSDDLYHKSLVQGIQNVFRETDLQAVGFNKGYICNYPTKEVAEYNPLTNPPFFTIKFPRDIFIDPLKHINYTGLKKDVGKYKAGTPCPSHEYIGDCLKYGIINERGFIVGCHGENVSTHFNHPYKGEKVSREILKEFGIYDVPNLKIKFSLRKKILNKLPHQIRRKLRYWWSEKIYNWIRA